MSRFTLAAVIVIALAVITGCTIAPSKCTSNNCVINITKSNGQVVLQGSNAPTFPPPSFPASAKSECTALGGEADIFGFDGPYTYKCDDVYYVGSDGKNDYYTDIPVDGNALADAYTAGTGATERQCVSGWYPDASSGNPSGIPGKWDSVIGLCLPTVSNGYQDQFNH